MSSDLTRINTNVSALNALNALKGVNNELSDRQLRLSTGKRINNASDDAAGWVIGKTLESRSRGLGVAINNVGDASNLLSIAEGGLNSVLEVLLEMRDKIIQAASDTLGASERSAIDDQLADLANEIDSIVTRTQFNNVALIDGTYQNKTFQVGAESTDTLSVSIPQDHKASTLHVADSDLTVDSAANASTAL
ncbi:MAG TPA: flagellin, partial [Candidatus Brocadiia bacterium]|nr:flagellin [Candidatus Brocadiia bacterium]